MPLLDVQISSYPPLAGSADSLIGFLPDDIWLTDTDGRLLQVITSAVDGIPIELSAAPVRMLEDVLPPNVAARLTSAAQLSAGTGNTHTLDFVLSRDDRLKHYECRVAPVQENQTLTIIRDVTELKQAEAATQVILETIQGVSTTSNLKELLDHIYHSISRYLYSENCFVALRDLKAPVLEMEYFVDRYAIVPPSGEELAGSLAYYAFEMAEPMLLTESAICALVNDGVIKAPERLPSAWLSVPLRTPHGTIGVFVVQHYEDSSAYSRRDLELLASIGDQIGVAIDRKRAENEMYDAKSFLNRVIDNLPSLIYVKDRSGRYILTNRAFADIHGRDVKDVIGKTDVDLLGQTEDVDRYALADRHVLSHQRDYVNEEEQITDAEGKTHWLQSVKRPLMGAAGVEYILGIATDLTERKFLEQKLRQAQKLESIGQLSAGIAHEINTPTQYVGDNVRFLQTGFADYQRVLQDLAELAGAGDSGAAENVRRMMDDADLEFLDHEVPKAIEQALDGLERIVKIVRSMKDFAHPGSDDYRSADLNQVIENAVTISSNEWKYTADVVRHYDPKLPAIPCLASELSQVFLNMIVNAAHAIGEKQTAGEPRGTITICTRTRGDSLEIIFADTGIGMDEETRKRVFDPFFTTKEVGRGTGQGLAISHRVIVEKHRGTIEVASRPGIGTAFTISLPLKKAESTGTSA